MSASMKAQKSGVSIGQLAGGFIAAASLAAAFNASAHVPEKYQHILKGSEAFIMHMVRPDAGTICCNGDDAQVDMPERVVRGADGKEHYEVYMTEDLDGKPTKPVWYRIRDEAVLSDKFSRAFCSAYKKEHPDDPTAKTCNPPDTNIMWRQSYTNEDGTPGYVYCYWPKPKGF